MRWIFYSSINFIADISGWDVSRVTDADGICATNSERCFWVGYFPCVRRACVVYVRVLLWISSQHFEIEHSERYFDAKNSIVQIWKWKFADQVHDECGRYLLPVIERLLVWESCRMLEQLVFHRIPSGGGCDNCKGTGRVRLQLHSSDLRGSINVVLSRSCVCEVAVMMTM
jgi:surface protein